MRYQHAHFRTRHGFGGKMVARGTTGAVAAYGTIAQVNRNTGHPHEHTREIARNTMSITERRAAGYNDRP